MALQPGRLARAPGRGVWRSAPLWIAILFFAAVAPTLPWLEFSSGSEQLNVATVLEMRNGGPWFIPNLNGGPRITKPPLTAWISAATVSQATVDRLASDDLATRERSYRSLAWQIRLVALLTSCLTLWATYDLAATLGGARMGGLTALVAGSSLLWLRFGRSSTTDVQLALWVTAANALLARAVLRGQWRYAPIGAGLALGLALMSKGPVALLQSVVPVAAFAGWMAWRRPATPEAGIDRLPRIPSHGRLALLAGACLMLAVALPWPLYVLHSNPGIIQNWKREITREGATDHPFAPVWSYLSLLPNLLPWLAMFIAGAVRAWQERRALSRGRLLGLMLLIIPMAIMSLVRDKNERYLLPMLAPAAFLAAEAAAATLDAVRSHRVSPASRLLLNIHWSLVGAIPAGIAIFGVSRTLLAKGEFLLRPDGRVWYSSGLAIGATALGGLILVGGIAMQRRHAWGFIAAAVVSILFGNALFMWGYSKGATGVAEMKPIAYLIRAAHPDAEPYYYDPRKAPKPMLQDLSIYLDRVTYVVRKLGEVPAQGGRPQVIVMLRRKEENPPQIPGWRVLGHLPTKNREWFAFDRAPLPAAASPLAAPSSTVPSSPEPPPAKALR